MTPDRIASFWSTRDPHVQPKPEPTDARKAQQERERRKGLEHLSAEARERNAKFNHGIVRVK